MLLQPMDDVEESMLLLPAWPCEWDVAFRLAGPMNTYVSGKLVNGTLSYTVEPKSRAGAVKPLKCEATSADVAHV